jgi:hypothetical protein
MENGERDASASCYIARVRASDTTPASHAAQMEVYRRLGPAGRVRLAASLSADTRELTRAGIRSRHPAYTDEEVDLALRRVLYGDDLVGRAWPGGSLIEP